MKTIEVLTILSELTDDPEFSALLASDNKYNKVKEAINQLQKLLSNSPNFELSISKVQRNTDDISGSLKGLIALSKYDKQKWISIIDEFGLPIELNPRASTRDVIGKVLAYLDANPEVLAKSRKSKSRPLENTTLEDTLNKLMNFKS